MHIQITVIFVLIFFHPWLWLLLAFLLHELFKLIRFTSTSKQNLSTDYRLLALTDVNTVIETEQYYLYCY